MTEKVCLMAIKRTQNSFSPLCLCVLCGKKTKPSPRGKRLYARKSFPFAHKTRIKPAAERGGKWRTLSDYVAENGGLCRVNAPSIMAFLSALCVLCGKKTKPSPRGKRLYARKSLSFAHKTRINPAAERGGKWRILSDYVAENGGFCRTVWRKMADFVE